MGAVLQEDARACAMDEGGHGGRQEIGTNTDFETGARGLGVLRACNSKPRRLGRVLVLWRMAPGPGPGR